MINKIVNSKSAFTLAEVLITLGIIGVVAALTFPALVSKYKSAVLENRFKKAYSNISQAILKVKNDSGIDNLKNYCGDKTKEEECVSYFVKQFQITEEQFDRKDDIYNFTGTSTPDSNTRNLFCKVNYPMNDGSYIKITSEWGRLNFVVDTNGKEKPNRLGHDLFLFYMTDNDKLQGIKATGTIISDERLEEYRNNSTNENNAWQYERSGNPCTLRSKQKANGYGCAYFALIDENPDDSSKSYWKTLP